MNDRITIEMLMDETEATERMRELTRQGLSETPPWIPPVWFYDDRGSDLFDEITRLPEYYPTNAEREVLIAHATEIARLTHAQTLVELGSGTSEKTRVLLDALSAEPQFHAFTPFDISAGVLQSATVQIAERWPRL